jgi:hypothetical protein
MFRRFWRHMPGEGQQDRRIPPYAYLLFPITVWVLGGKSTDESIDLYWYGIRLVFSVSSGEVGIKRPPPARRRSPRTASSSGRSDTPDCC